MLVVLPIHLCSHSWVSSSGLRCVVGLQLLRILHEGGSPSRNPLNSGCLPLPLSSGKYRGGTLASTSSCLIGVALYAPRTTRKQLDCCVMSALAMPRGLPPASVGVCYAAAPYTIAARITFVSRPRSHNGPTKESGKNQGHVKRDRKPNSGPRHHKGAPRHHDCGPRRLTCAPTLGPWIYKDPGGTHNQIVRTVLNTEYSPEYPLLYRIVTPHSVLRT